MHGTISLNINVALTHVYLWHWSYDPLHQHLQIMLHILVLMMLANYTDQKVSMGMYACMQELVISGE